MTINLHEKKRTESFFGSQMDFEFPISDKSITSNLDSTGNNSSDYSVKILKTLNSNDLEVSDAFHNLTAISVSDRDSTNQSNLWSSITNEQRKIKTSNVTSSGNNHKLSFTTSISSSSSSSSSVKIKDGNFTPSTVSYAISTGKVRQSQLKQNKSSPIGAVICTTPNVRSAISTFNYQPHSRSNSVIISKINSDLANSQISSIQNSSVISVKRTSTATSSLKRSKAIKYKHGWISRLMIKIRKNLQRWKIVLSKRAFRRANLSRQRSLLERSSSSLLQKSKSLREAKFDSNQQATKKIGNIGKRLENSNNLYLVPDLKDLNTLKSSEFRKSLIKAEEDGSLKKNNLEVYLEKEKEYIEPEKIKSSIDEKDKNPPEVYTQRNISNYAVRPRPKYAMLTPIPENGNSKFSPYPSPNIQAHPGFNNTQEDITTINGEKEVLVQIEKQQLYNADETEKLYRFYSNYLKQVLINRIILKLEINEKLMDENNSQNGDQDTITDDGMETLSDTTFKEEHALEEEQNFVGSIISDYESADYESDDITSNSYDDSSSSTATSESLVECAESIYNEEYDNLDVEVYSESNYDDDRERSIFSISRQTSKISNIGGDFGPNVSQKSNITYIEDIVNLKNKNEKTTSCDDTSYHFNPYLAENNYNPYMNTHCEKLEDSNKKNSSGSLRKSPSFLISRNYITSRNNSVISNSPSFVLNSELKRKSSIINVGKC
ncbi:hypothetical protein PACTADRAFT_34079 [Pachysolen tannophilus NRRL Y-2460]|uniref:Uncharacterized protein n=1 Tax=Pachysolen tannophilus NRRL Y-2460 TaxID=669874 RepID=A0A1E4TUR7_PACTA|nr:hypothetical protein PACTADRAFT_34079 [Pachysolen tannophilus NRRL Y-2460]